MGLKTIRSQAAPGAGSGARNCVCFVSKPPKDAYEDAKKSAKETPRLRPPCHSQSWGRTPRQPPKRRSNRIPMPWPRLQRNGSSRRQIGSDGDRLGSSIDPSGSTLAAQFSALRSAQKAGGCRRGFARLTQAAFIRAVRIESERKRTRRQARTISGASGRRSRRRRAVKPLRASTARLAQHNKQASARRARFAAQRSPPALKVFPVERGWARQKKEDTTRQIANSAATVVVCSFAATTEHNCQNAA